PDQHAVLALVRESATRFQPVPLRLLPADVPDRRALLRRRPPARHSLRFPRRAHPRGTGRRRWPPPASLAVGPALRRPWRALPRPVLLLSAGSQRHPLPRPAHAGRTWLGPGQAAAGRAGVRRCLCLQALRALLPAL